MPIQFRFPHASYSTQNSPYIPSYPHPAASVPRHSQIPQIQTFVRYVVHAHNKPLAHQDNTEFHSAYSETVTTVCNYSMRAEQTNLLPAHDI